MALLVLVWEIIERGVAAADALELVVEVENDFSQGHAERHLHTISRQVDLVGEDAPLLDAQSHHGTDVFGFCDDLGFDEGFFDEFQVVGVRKVGRIVHDDVLAGLGSGTVAHVGHRRDDRHVELPLEAFLDNFHVQHPEEATAKTESQSCGRLRLKHQRGIVELEFLHGAPQFLVLVGVHGVDAGKNHGLHILESLNGLAAGCCTEGQCVSDLDLLGVLDSRYDITYIPSAQGIFGDEVEAQHPDFVGIVLASCGQKLHLIPFAQPAIHDPEVGDDAAKGVEDAVENHGLKGGVQISLGRSNPLHHRFQNLGHPKPRLAAGRNDVFLLAPDEVDDLVTHPLGVCRVQVHFVQHWNDFQVML